MDAHEADSQQVLPLPDAGLVAEGLPFACDDADFCVVRFDVGNLRHVQCHGLPVGEKGERAGLVDESAVKPLVPFFIAQGHEGHDCAQEDGVDQQRFHIDYLNGLSAHQRAPEQVMDEEQQQDGGGQQGKRQINFIAERGRFGQQVLQGDGARAEHQTNQQRLRNRVLQAEEDGCDERCGEYPVCDACDRLHVDKNT